MEIMQLKMFVALVEEGNALRAARRVFRTPPALSLALKKLEEEAGFPLFDREDRSRYLLTPAGAMLYSYALRLLRTHSEALAAVQQARHQPQSHEPSTRNWNKSLGER